MKILNSFGLIIIAFTFASTAQSVKGRVETIAKFPPVVDAGKKCADVKPGVFVSSPQPEYPAQARAARVGGTVLINLKLNEKGAFSEIIDVSGNEMLRAAAARAARRVKFSPTLCDGAPSASTVVVLYNFASTASNAAYFKASKIENFADVKKDSPFYEAILNLTENHNLAFGYADGKFYADAPLTHGDLAEFLRRTLDLLAARAKEVDKLPRQINLFSPLNPQNLKVIVRTKDLSEKHAYFDSLKTLLLTYDIALTNEQQEFKGENALTRRAVVELWTSVFGADAVPVNFALSGRSDDERLMTRGEFALFLTESLDVLTYKVLP